MEKSDFRVMVRRVPGYEPTVSLRFEMREGYGELHVGERRRASPSALGEVAEVGGEAVRGGRFVHVLASGRRRQSYAFSRLDDDRLQRLPDDKWVELAPVTEFGIRYLDLPDLPALESPGKAVAVQVSSTPAPARAAASASPPPSDARAASDGGSLLGRVRATGGTASARASTSAPAAASVAAAPAAERQAQPGASATTRSPPPARVAGPAEPRPPLAPRGVAVSESIGKEAVDKMSTTALKQALLAEMAKVDALHEALDDASRRLEASMQREQDLVAVIQRWSQRG